MSKANDLTPDSSLYTDKSRKEINAKQISSFEPRRLEPKATEALKTNRPGGMLRTAGLLEALLLGPLCTRSPISALIELGTDWRPRIRSHAILSANLHQ